MADEKEFSGVDDVFASIRSDERPDSDVLKPTDSDVGVKEAAKEEEREKKMQPSSQTTVERPRARVGRFPGSRNKNGPVQDKISGRISATLKDKYVDWALTDRCSINELLENALTEYYQRYRAAGEPKKED
jgi:hypothetical protein